MNRFAFALILTCALPVVTVARPGDAPQAQDRHRDSDRSTPDNASDAAPAPAPKSDPGPDRQGKTNVNFSAEEKEETENFLATNSPRRWNALKSHGLHVTRFMVARYLELRRLQADDADLYNIRVQEIKADDEVFALGKQAANDPSAKEKLHTAEAALFDLRVQEQALRIKKLAELLRAEQDKLDRMNKNRDKIIEKHELDAKRGTLFGPAAGDVGRDHIEASPSSEPAE